MSLLVVIKVDEDDIFNLGGWGTLDLLIPFDPRKDLREVVPFEQSITSAEYMGDGPIFILRCPHDVSEECSTIWFSYIEEDCEWILDGEYVRIPTDEEKEFVESWTLFEKAKKLLTS